MTNKLFAFLICAVFSVACHASLCESGLRQSPIDIQVTQKKHLSPLVFGYLAAPLRLANDGHTVRVRFKNSGALQIGSQTYTLQQFHFHTPGGDRINGQEFPMAAHILHKSASGQLLAITVPFRLGAENPLLDSVFSHIPKQKDGDHEYSAELVNTRSLLPKDHGYYRYSGSLTASPCTEGVDWIVMKNPVELSPAQLVLYKSFFADNIRAPRPLNHRVVMESQ